MNVYSVRLIPNLKLKLCQFLGIASVMAVDELSLRLESLERKLDRLDLQLRRPANRALPVLARTSPKTVKKKPAPSRKAAAVTRPKKKLAAVHAAPPAELAAELESPLILNEEAPPMQATAPELPARRQAVVLLQADEHTRRSVAEYFGSEVELIEAGGAVEAATAFDEFSVLALLFDRGQLGQVEFRLVLETLAQAYPETRMIGLSSYLTLALADALPQREDFATFLTRPLSAASLAEAFGQDRRQAIS